jgi:hypothetical protein
MSKHILPLTCLANFLVAREVCAVKQQPNACLVYVPVLRDCVVHLLNERAVSDAHPETVTACLSKRANYLLEKKNNGQNKAM